MKTFQYVCFAHLMKRVQGSAYLPVIALQNSFRVTLPHSIAPNLHPQELL